MRCPPWPAVGLSPRIQTRCWRVVSTMCQAGPNRSPWQCAMDRIARMHCRFFAVSITGPCWAEGGSEAVGRGVPTATTWCR